MIDMSTTTSTKGTSKRRRMATITLKWPLGLPVCFMVTALSEMQLSVTGVETSGE